MMRDIQQAIQTCGLVSQRLRGLRGSSPQSGTEPGDTLLRLAIAFEGLEHALTFATMPENKADGEARLPAILRDYDDAWRLWGDASTFVYDMSGDQPQLIPDPFKGHREAAADGELEWPADWGAIRHRAIHLSTALQLGNHAKHIWEATQVRRQELTSAKDLAKDDGLKQLRKRGGSSTAVTRQDQAQTDTERHQKAALILMGCGLRKADAAFVIYSIEQRLHWHNPDEPPLFGAKARDTVAQLLDERGIKGAGQIADCFASKGELSKDKENNFFRLKYSQQRIEKAISGLGWRR